MGNKVKFNLKNVHAAKLIETETDGVTSFSLRYPQGNPRCGKHQLGCRG